MALTVRDLNKLKPQDRTYIVSDGEVPGLELVVHKTGKTMTWSLRYRIRRTQRRMTIGVYPRMALAEARKEANRQLRAVDGGHDPQLAKKADRKALTVGEFAAVYIEHHAKKKKRSWKEDQRILDSYVLPVWKNRAVAELTRGDVRELLEPMADKTPTMANRTLALIRKMLNVAVDREVITANPVLRFAKPGEEESRDRVLNEDEIRTFWKSTKKLDPAMAAFFQLRLVTAQRSIEVSTMRWSDIDGRWWTIPGSITKNGLSHRVWLSQTARDIIDSLPKSADGYVVSGARGKRQQSEAAKTFKIDDFRGHDLRRTAASLMTGGGVSRLVVSRILNHVETGVTAVYDRHSYDAEKQAALEWWGLKLTAILKQHGSTVLPFARPA